MSIFDQSERKKQQGIEASYQGANSYWKSAAKEALRECALNMREFTADEVQNILAKKGVTTSNNSALGAVFQGASRAAIIQKTGHYRESNRPVTHGRPVAIWKSNIRRNDGG